jgi:hypothetical protein
MTVLLAVAVVGAGSLFFRLAPLMGAHLLSDRLARVSGWAGLAVLAAISVRAVALHRDDTVPGAPLLAPLLAALAVGTGLVLAHRGRSVLTSVASGAAV